MAPAVRAVLVQEPDFDTQSVDIFACTGTLGSLVRFLKEDNWPFRFLVEAVGKTVFITRREGAPDAKILGPKGFGRPTGCGRTFPERYTKKMDGFEDSDSHQRMVAYDFADLRCIVRFQADRYIEEKLMDECDQQKAYDRGEDGNDTVRSETPEIHGLRFCQGGQLIPQHSIFELKTRGINKKNDNHLADHIPRLWQAQIAFFILAFHEWGTFKPDNIIVRDVREDIELWQRNNQSLLRSLSHLLKELIKLARDPDFGKFEVCCEKPSILEVRQQGGNCNAPLPKELAPIWANDVMLARGSDGGNGASLGAK